MSETEDKKPRTARERLIEAAQVDVHQARSRATESRDRYGGEVPRPVALDLQNAIIDYYRALAPLRDDPEVSNWWSTVELSESWIKYQRGEERLVVEGEAGGDGVRMVPKPAERDIPHTGLDSIATNIEGETVSQTSERHTMRGTTEETVTHQKVLSAGILVDIAGTLDDAAAKLGFRPDSDLHEGESDPV